MHMSGSDSHAQEYMAAMRADLRNVVSSESLYYNLNHRYTTDGSKLPMRLSTGVQSLQIILTPDGFGASVGHVAIANRCAVFVGSTRHAPAKIAGEPSCTRDPLGAGLTSVIGVILLAAALAAVTYFFRDRPAAKTAQLPT